MKLKNIVDFINCAIKASLTDERFDGSEYEGIAVTMPRDNGSGTVENFPVVVDSNGEGKDLSYDDSFPLRLYHKNNGVNYAPSANGNYGAANNNMQTGTATMSMIVTAMRDKIKLTPEELNELLLKGLPTKMSQPEAKALNIQSVKIQPANTDFNFSAVFGREYKVTDLKGLPADIIMLELKYKIDATFDKSCIDIPSN